MAENNNRLSQEIRLTGSTKPSAILGCMKPINLDTSSCERSCDMSRSPNTRSSLSMSNLNTSSPLRCRMRGRMAAGGGAATRAVPLFLSNYEEESHQQLSEYAFAGGDRRFGSGGLKKARAGRIVAGIAVVSAIAAVLALFSIDSTRAVIFNASLGGGGGSAPPPAQLAAAVPEPAQPQRSIAAPPLAAEPTGAEVAAARRTPPNAVASASPSRDEIAAAYQSALKGKVAGPEPVAREAAREVVAAVSAGEPRSSRWLRPFVSPCTGDA
jgi:hypothetical protein